MSKELIKYNLLNKRSDLERKADVSYLSKDTIDGIRKFHQGFKEYSMTPMYRLRNLADYLGVRDIFVKDESKRFGLNAFKVLGASYAMGKYLAEKLGVDLEEIDFEYFKSDQAKEKLGEITFVTATDGNHGRGVAWAARQLGQKSVVYMPKGSSQIRLENIRNEGAEASIIDGNYDDAVRLSDQMAEEHGWVVVQDTAWEGYEDIPRWIMQGYGTLIDEAIKQLKVQGVTRPTHVFLQAGVGSFAGAVQGHLASLYTGERPVTIIMESNVADCLYKSSLEGSRQIVGGSMSTIMAGLACGEPNTISYNILNDYSDGYFSCPDHVAARGMRILSSPLGNDARIISGESGAVGMGVVSLLMERDEYKDLREAIGLDEKSEILIISTEGDTDPEKYKEIVWDGDYTSI